MYNTILVPVENRETDQTILRHIRPLARLAQVEAHAGPRRGWMGGAEFRAAQASGKRGDASRTANIWRSSSASLQAEGFEVSSVLAMGDPATEIIKLARSSSVDLVAMTTHGHRFISDLLYGSTADKVRHQVEIPVLLLKVKN